MRSQLKARGSATQANEGKRGENAQRDRCSPLRRCFVTPLHEQQELRLERHASNSSLSRGKNSRTPKPANLAEPQAFPVRWEYIYLGDPHLYLDDRDDCCGLSCNALDLLVGFTFLDPLALPAPRSAPRMLPLACLGLSGLLPVALGILPCQEKLQSRAERKKGRCKGGAAFVCASESRINLSAAFKYAVFANAAVVLSCAALRSEREATDPTSALAVYTRTSERHTPAAAAGTAIGSSGCRKENSRNSFEVSGVSTLMMLMSQSLRGRTLQLVVYRQDARGVSTSTIIISRIVIAEQPTSSSCRADDMTRDGISKSAADDYCHRTVLLRVIMNPVQSFRDSRDFN